MAELALAVQLAEKGARARDTLHHVRCWAEVSHLACERFGHPMFTGDTLERLEAFMQEATGLGDDREAMLRLPLPEVVKLLRKGGERKGAKAGRKRRHEHRDRQIRAWFAQGLDANRVQAECKSKGWEVSADNLRKIKSRPAEAAQS